MAAGDTSKVRNFQSESKYGPVETFYAKQGHAVSDFPFQLLLNLVLFCKESSN